MIVDVERRPTVLWLSLLYVLFQIPDFCYAYIYYGLDDVIAFDIHTSFWFLVNGVIGVEYSCFFILNYLIQTHRPPLICVFSVLVLLGMGWTVIAYVGLFMKLSLPYYLTAKVWIQTIVYVFTTGIYLS